MNNPLITIFFLLTSIWGGYSQSKSLKSILIQIEKKNNVSFSYSDKIVEDIYITFENRKKSLQDILRNIENTTNLKFSTLDDNRFIAISKTKLKTKQSIYQKLEEVYISKYLTGGILKNTTGGITIKPKKFGILPGLIEPDILQIIQSLPGVISANEDVSNVSIRGGTPDQNLILYDGIKMYQTGHFFGLISAFNPYLTKKISVYRHGTKAKYGDGVSSTINIELADEKSSNSKIGVGLNLISTDGFAVIPISNKTEIQIALRRSTTDIVNTPTYNQYFKKIFQDSDLTNTEDAAISKNEKFVFHDAALKFLYNPSKKDKIRFNFLSIYNALNYEEEAITSIKNKNSKSSLKQQNYGFGLKYNRYFNSNLNALANVYSSSYSLESINFNILENQRLAQHNEVLDSGIKLALSYNLNRNLNIETGLQISQVAISNLEDINSPSFKRLQKKAIVTYSNYLEGNYNSVNKNTFARVGIRHNYLKKFDKHIIEPRFYLSQQLLKYFKIDFSGELKSQSTSQVIDLQKDFLGIEKRRWIISNNNTIPIIKSKQITLGISYKQNDLLVSAEAFSKKVDGITSKSQGFQNQYQFISTTGNYKVEGIDFLINKQFTKFSTWLSYSISKNNYNLKNLNNNKVFPNNLDINHAINFSSTYSIKNFKIAFGINWHSAKPNTKPNSKTPIKKSVINYQKPNSSNLNHYLRTDFSTTYQFKIINKKASIGISIWNILNRNNTLNSYYQLNNNQVSQINNQSLGFTPNLSFRLWI